MTNSIFGNLKFGALDMACSIYGPAIKNASGQLVSYNKSEGEIIDVEPLSFNISSAVFALPCAVKDVQEGDCILHTNDRPVFVTKVENGDIQAIDVVEGAKKIILPVKSIFGFNYVTKVVCLFDSFAEGASEDNPFGSMLPFMLLDNSNEMNSNMNNLLPLMLMQKGGDFTLDFSDPLMMMALMGGMNGGSESNNFFPFLIMMKAAQKKKEEVYNPF